MNDTYVHLAFFLKGTSMWVFDGKTKRQLAEFEELSQRNPEKPPRTLTIWQAYLGKPKRIKIFNASRNEWVIYEPRK